MPQGDAARPSRTVMLVATAIIVAGLYLAREFILPLALALLISFLLTPLVIRLERWKVGRVASVIIVVTLALGVVASLGYVVGRQALALLEDLPKYQQNVHEKMKSLRAAGGGFGQATRNLEEMGKELTGKAPPASAPSTQQVLGTPGQDLRHDAPDAVRQGIANLSGEPTTRPIQVEVKERDPTPFQYFDAIVGPYIGPLGTAGMITVFVIFFLLQREDLRDRLIRLTSGGGGQITLTTQALDDAATRISRYLLMQLIVNVTYGIPIGLGLYFIGVPNAFLWGMLAVLLRFIPYVGPWIAAAPPMLLAFAAFPGWGALAMTLALFVVVELVSNNVVEPWLYGSSTGLSATAILVSAVFWTWLWGPVGLLMSTPLTVCLVVLGKYVPQLQYLDILLGDEPVMSRPMRVYQRLLAYDQEEAADLVDEFLASDPALGLVGAYDHVLIPALRLAERDRHEGRLDADREAFVRRSMRELVEDLGERHGATAVAAATTPPAGNGDDEVDEGRRARTVLCLPARDEADEIAALMTAQALGQVGISARYTAVAALASETVQAVERAGGALVCISALPPSALTHARYLCKRLRARPGGDALTLTIGLWTTKLDVRKAQERLSCHERDRVVTTLADAVAHIQSLVAIEADKRATPASPIAG